MILTALAGLVIGGADAPAEKWEVIETQSYRLHYAPGSESDAKKVRGFLDRTHVLLREEFADHKPDELLKGISCDVFLHSKPVENANEHIATITTGVYDGTYKAVIDLLMPSAYGPSFRSHIGEPFGDDYYAHLVAHEYSTIFLERVARSKPSGWRFFSAPAWFVQGYEDYLGLTQSTKANRETVLPRYDALHKGDAKRVSVGFGIGVTDPYADGAVLVHFMHEKYGRKKVQSILTSREATFEVAIASALGVSLDQFWTDWQAWRKNLQ
jgi:hypothetical protein